MSQHAAPAPSHTEAVVRVVDGNQLTPVIDGPAQLAALMALIENARVSLRLYYYIFEADASGTAVREALLDAINRGVTVSLIVDGFGSSAAPAAFFAPLQHAGCDFCRFLPRFGRRYLLRNHQKMAIADDGIAIIGGFNISDDYFRPPEEGGWHDMGLEVKGPAVTWLVDYFEILARWTREDKASIRSLRRILREMSVSGGTLCWLLGGPTRRLSPWARSVKHDLDRARSADMIEAYFSPGNAMLKRLRRIVKRGGRTRLVTAQISDNGATIGAARFLYGGLLRGKVEIYEYRPTKLHMKLIVIDDATYIGSANFDMRSLFLNLELMLRIEDADFAALARTFVDRELADCERITLELHKARAGFINRLKWALSYLVVGVADYTVTRRLNFGLD
ncbi:phospholipase D-like domain-containing protein [Sphingobium boeckii]|uniref:Phospholipase D n=1 Tax=Sphingobium boeckii TaxID=1082345 RepID=A0A7W9AJ13_9SPHN|nr:cardiolipin synthase B [Sphingobium boeckii]MBB5686572.1 cardiolipin synthase [Sphingobium boeckii]